MDDPNALQERTTIGAREWRLTREGRHRLLGLLALVLVVRLVSLATYPLMDSTEARYGEIARKMASSGDWVTPWYEDDVPFWGKPPLAFWLSASAISMLGADEFAVRLPSFVLGLGILGLVFAAMKRQRGEGAALVACMALAVTALFFVCSGAVLTDTSLAFCVTAAMLVFWRSAGASGRSARWWGLAVFAALGLGMLAKGPIVLPLVAAPIGAFCSATHRWESVRRLPWIAGTAAFLAIVVPWYLAAEARTPGFLEYFVLGEHFQRYTDSGWTGDLYGSVHTQPRGYIWVCLLVAALPWTPWLLYRATRACLRDGLGASFRRLAHGDSWRLYLVLWAASPALLFTLAGSVLATYLLPGIPALAILVGDLVADEPAPGRQRRLLAPGSWRNAAIAVPLLAGLAVVYVNLVVAPERSQASLVSRMETCDGAVRVAYWQKRPFSASFYTEGRALEVSDPKALRQGIGSGAIDYVVSRARDGLPDDVSSALFRIARSGSLRHGSVLWGVGDRARPTRCRGRET